ncbi:MAG: NAD-dependent malic enzyme [Nitrospirae bacterium CG_4_10_14_0_8_um_filter_41_23]|nr:NAD-dependent malic enzyme [Nitrospirota bacterium]OIP58781.1 MAG: NAD-dependent malic enzyme [Nitrospirae bacterium CG2_30_41_42]PIQ95059.1 MAG: NAD-dependent malic enzyme [Nitrospirae bacterium CG11_big_fil_rev_8_21_14_0_20_41_14]PIV41619.1 MAG: NAD-dependent malic enzyme [Nitrospirae bacterium CG02_land_8_20_14_3_00_41_53]PIW86667.1 MAG: NAD-dependent malic enzyme [Nitrospirae bacterium CG_4_8_14_3_um_filter_41_47]PIY86296.1 MAG: NAD-dependent malic enzyme [Nitrospirae bacterium CG_4_10_
MKTTPSPSYSITLRLEIVNQVGMFGKIATAIGKTGGDIGAVDIVRVGKGMIVRDITINARDEAHEKNIVNAVKKIKGVRVIHVSDRTFLLHHGGKIEIHNKVPVKNRNDLSRVYTPGVARVCMAIHHDKEKAYRFTIKRNSVAIITDGSAVLGLGDIGPEAALPVMEGKAMIFKEFANIDAFPICLSTEDTEEIIKTIKYISPAFGGINLEDVSSPRCFEIEERLKKELDIPVFHDDQHGTAVVILAALINAVKIVGKQLKRLKIVISGAGAAGTACCKILKEVGITNIIICDRKGAIYKSRKRHMNPVKIWLSENTNPAMIKGSISDSMEGADVFIGVSAPNLITVDDIKRMTTDPIVFALANPEPEIAPEDTSPHVRILATGRSDYPNQINNMLCFPGLFRGLLDSRARTVNEEIKLAAAKAIASMVDEKELSEDYIVPSIFDRKVVTTVASSVSDAAYRTGVARKER